MDGTSRPSLDSKDRASIGEALALLIDHSANLESSFYLTELKKRIMTPAKGRPHPASMENLSAMHYATKG